ncbi:MAG: hypothetical protein ACLPYW_12805 [Acidimicrobiales bacterium]
MDIAEAAEWLADRGVVTRTVDCALPSLFEACHEEAYVEGGVGFASWPRTKWSWAGTLGERDDVFVLKIHNGKNVFLTPETLALADPICRAEMVRMRADDPVWARLLDYLADVGPAVLSTVQEELGLRPPELKALRYPLERCGALVSRQLVLEADAGGGHEHTSQIARFDQLVPAVKGSDRDPAAAFAELVVAGVRAAVVAPERELGRWFSWRWYFDAGLVDRLVSEDRLSRPAPGWVSTGNI